MVPKTLVLDEIDTPKTFDALHDLLETKYRVTHEATTLEAVELRPDGTVTTSAGQSRLTRGFLEGCVKAIGMPLPYADKITPELFCDNFMQRRRETTTPVTICRVGDVATGLVVDGKYRYRPAPTTAVLRSVHPAHDLEFRRATVTFAGVDVELVRRGITVEPAVGDVVEVGIALTNSESGGRQFKAMASSFRLSCLNGATMADAIGVARWPNDPRMNLAGCLRALEHDMARLVGKSDRVTDLYRSAVSRMVPANEMWNLWRRVAYVVSRAQADRILGIEEPARIDLQQLMRTGTPQDQEAPSAHVAYEVHNRITHAAHGQSFYVRRGLQEIGGELLSRAAEWPPLASAN